MRFAVTVAFSTPWHGSAGPGTSENRKCVHDFESLLLAPMCCDLECCSRTVPAAIQVAPSPGEKIGLLCPTERKRLFADSERRLPVLTAQIPPARPLACGRRSRLLAEPAGPGSSLSVIRASVCAPVSYFCSGQTVLDGSSGEAHEKVARPFLQLLGDLESAKKIFGCETVESRPEERMSIGGPERAHERSPVDSPARAWKQP